MISPVAEMPTGMPPIPTVAETNRSEPTVFRNLIRQLGGEPGPIDQTAPELAERLAETGARRMMADAFLVPLLKELRANTAPKGMFAPGPGEKRFGTMYDQAIADRMLDANNFPVADALVEKLRESFQRVLSGVEFDGGARS